MASNRPAADRPRQDRHSTPDAQIMRTPSAPPGAPTKLRSEQRPRTPPSQIIPIQNSPPGAPGASGGSRYTDRFPSHASSDKPRPSTDEIDMEEFLSVPPFSGAQVQCILWLSWTTTASPTQIAHMHNRVFVDSPQKMTRWNVVDIENSIATNWHKRGGSFGGMKPLPLLVPPGDDNRGSCLCDFGVANCYDYKRDQESEENLEKLSMARSLWDALPKEMVRCPHGTRRPADQELVVQDPAAQPLPAQGTRTAAFFPSWTAILLTLVVEMLFLFFR